MGTAKSDLSLELIDCLLASKLTGVLVSLRGRTDKMMTFHPAVLRACAYATKLVYAVVDAAPKYRSLVISQATRVFVEVELYCVSI